MITKEDALRIADEIDYADEQVMLREFIEGITGENEKLVLEMDTLACAKCGSLERSPDLKIIQEAIVALEKIVGTGYQSSHSTSADLVEVSDEIQNIAVAALAKLKERFG